MSSRPIDFNGMIQNANQVSTVKAQEDSHANIQQSALQTYGQQQEAKQSTTVQEAPKTFEEKFDPENGGDGTGYTGNENRKKKKVKPEEAKETTGKVRKKNDYGSFDITI